MEMEGFKDHDNCSISKEHFPIKIYLCKYCGRDFINPQALGGHQNAHKMERREARLHKQAKVLSMMMANYGGGGGGAPLMPACCFVQPHGITLLQDNNNDDGGEEGSCSSFSSSNNNHHHHQQPPLNNNYWPGSYRLEDGPYGGSYHDNPVPPPRITYHEQYHVYDGGADERVEDGGGGVSAQRGLQLELPDLNENY
ncbi:zinc finger protein 3-like [Spinacia oleracea]|uniref:Zinc finger protein 3-like n=1 Tax=Spinacia oleracea TaxID=3562 RepID=A0A9R0HUJ1_SPIOL|nr:zinc finger protein 3-like [Spinacia oleracea]